MELNFNNFCVRVRGYEGEIVTLDANRVAYFGGNPIVLNYDLHLRLSATEKLYLEEVEANEIEFLSCAK